LSQAVPDDLEGKEVLALLTQDPAQAFDVVVVELAVSRGRSLRVDQALTFEESDLRDGHVGKFLAQEAQDISDGQVTPAGHL
jgi:hypothetical protein